MTFYEQLLASFIGTAFGFGFAILLFFRTNAIKTHFAKKTLHKHVKREIEYDISLIQEWINEVDGILRKVTAKDPEVYNYLKFTFFQRYFFLQEALKKGIMYDALDNEDISHLSTILLHYDFGTQQFINSSIQQWKDQQITQQNVLRIFEFQKGVLQKHTKYLKDTLKGLN